MVSLILFGAEHQSFRSLVLSRVQIAKRPGNNRCCCWLCTFAYRDQETNSPEALELLDSFSDIQFIKTAKYKLNGEHVSKLYDTISTILKGERCEGSEVCYPVHHTIGTEKKSEMSQAEKAKKRDLEIKALHMYLSCACKLLWRFHPRPAHYRWQFATGTGQLLRASCYKSPNFVDFSHVEAHRDFQITVYTWWLCTSQQWQRRVKRHLWPKEDKPNPHCESSMQ